MITSNSPIGHFMRQNRFNNVPITNRVIGNFSGGLASTISCYYAIQEFENLELVFADTSIEHPDTYRLIAQFEKLTSKKVTVLSHDKFNTPESVWRHYLGMNFATGAACSSTLKRDTIKRYKSPKEDFGEILGYDISEIRRATNFTINNPDINAIYPLIERKLHKNDLFDIAKDLGFLIPSPYRNFLNNNCMGADDSPVGGCVQGGIGYWKKIKEIFPLKYDRMADLEHELTDLRFEKRELEGGALGAFTVVSICKDQRAKTKGNRLFLKSNPKFPEIETIDVIKGRVPITVFECGISCADEVF